MKKNYDSDEEIEIDLREIAYALYKRLWMIVLALILGGGLVALYSSIILTPQYTSTAMVYILSKETTLTSLADLQIGSQLTKDYKVVATSRPVLQKVIDMLGLERDYDDLKRSLVLVNPADTRVLSISIEDPDPVRSKAIVDTVARVSSQHIGDIMEMTPPKVIEEGIVSPKKSSPRVSANAAIGGVAAAILVSFLIVLQVVLNDTIRSEEDVEKYLEISVLAVIPERVDSRTSGSKEKETKRKRKNRGKG